ncbi:MAG TPA: hypothetical protein VFK88_00315 [Gallionella sp.]|nr:hypothetical protein [Gallionella sp.]
MAVKLDLTAEEAYEIADSFAQASARVLDYRIAHRDHLAPAESDELEKCEDRLDHMVVMFRGYGIQLIGAKASDAVLELKAAIEIAKAAMEQVEKIKDAIKLASALVELAVALTSKDPKAILAAAKALKTSAGAEKEK